MSAHIYEREMIDVPENTYIYLRKKYAIRNKKLHAHAIQGHAGWCFVGGVLKEVHFNGTAWQYAKVNRNGVRRLHVAFPPSTPDTVRMVLSHSASLLQIRDFVD